MDVTAACDFFVAPTATFKVLYVFVVLSHARREILHVNVTKHPTAAWTARQILEAFPGNVPRLLLHDRDSIYGWEFEQMVKALKIREIRSAPRSRGVQILGRGRSPGITGIPNLLCPTSLSLPKTPRDPRNAGFDR